MTTTATNAISRLIEIDTQKRALEDQLKDLNAERSALEAELLDQWAEEGVQHVRQNGMTVYLHRQLWASVKPEERPRAVQAFEAAGLEDMLSVNTQTLSAWWRERADVEEQEEGGIPETIKELVNVEERYAIRTRRSS